MFGMLAESRSSIGTETAAWVYEHYGLSHKRRVNLEKCVFPGKDIFCEGILLAYCILWSVYSAYSIQSNVSLLKYHTVITFSVSVLYSVCTQCWGKLLLKVMHYNIALLLKKVTNYVT